PNWDWTVGRSLGSVPRAAHSARALARRASLALPMPAYHACYSKTMLVHANFYHTCFVNLIMPY
ncbi:hypothetical protein HAX54_017958, partial [Datura stramonium]|nr:hypothetical protein [Datura stramonium]